jgi:hypothetical protein
MNLKDFLTSRESPPELYWSLVVEKGWVQAGIWYINESSAEVINISPSAAWEVEGELIGACDAVLSSCVSKLPENYTEPSKTVFGVSSSWVKEGEITDEYLAMIKTVCTDLSLTPVGFVVLPEAIAHLYKSEEGSPLSAVVIGLSPEELEISVFNLGNLIGTTSVARSVSIIEDVTEGLSRFEGASPLPSRMIVFDGKEGELEEAKEELMKATWEGNEKMKFLHTPKAETLESSKKVLATCLAGAAEIGNVTEVFSKEEPIGEETYPPEAEIKNVVEPDEETSAEKLGFSINEDVTSNQSPVSGHISLNSPITPPVLPIAQPQQKVNPQHQKFGVGVKNLFHTFSSKFKIGGPKISSQGNKKSLKLILIIAVVLIVGIGAYSWFVPKATITIFVAPKPFQQQVSISFNTQGVFDESKAILPAQIITSQASGDKTKSTTGAKLVGDKATGSVQIANGNTSSIKLATGTVLTSTSGLKFITNSEASISGQLLPGSPGTATLEVTAGDIGAQYNLAKGEVFKVGVFEKSLVAATSQTDFSGGSSQQIAAVSEEDQENLETDLKSELSSKVINDLESKASEDQLFVDDLAEFETTSKNFDHKVGEVAETLKLTSEINATTVLVDREKLQNYVANILKDKIPQGHALRNNQIKFKFTFISKEGENYIYTINISANFLPMTNSEEIISKISGKSVSSATEFLSSVPGYTRAEIALKNKLLGPFKTLPHVKDNITIEIAADQ